MRTRIKTVSINGKTKAVKEWKDFWGERCVGASVTFETPNHAQSSVRKVAAHRREQAPTAIELARHEQEQRKAAFMAMPRRTYRQVYGI